MTDGVSVVPPETIPGPDHWYVAPAVDEDPPSNTDVTVHVRTLASPASAFGRVLFNVTIAKSVAEQPLSGSVTVRVYVPAASTTGVAVLAPERMCPEFHATHEKTDP